MRPVDVVVGAEVDALELDMVAVMSRDGAMPFLRTLAAFLVDELCCAPQQPRS